MGGNEDTGKDLEEMNEFVVTSDAIDMVAVFVAVLSAIAVVLAILLKFSRLLCKKELVELKKAPLEKAFGIIFGKIGKNVVFSPAEADGHILTCAATGMGKTTTAITSLRQWGSIGEKDNGQIRRTMYCVDISGDIEKNCPRVHNKLVYAPLEKKTVPYNLFGSIDMLTDVIAQNEALEQLAILLMSEKENMNDNARFFLINGRKILTSALIACYHAGYDFPEICDMLMSNSWEKVFAEIDRMKNPEASNLLNCFVGANDVNTAGCFQQCTDAISLFGRSEAIKSSLRRPRTGEEAVEPNALETKNIFLKIPEDRLEMLKPLMRIISADIMNYITVRQVTEESPMILLFWDEFGSLKLDADTVVLPALRRARKRKCRIWVLCQNIADFTVLYGEAVTRSILSNFKYTLLLGGLGEPESQRYFADFIGYKKTVTRSVTKSTQNVSHTESEQREYIIEPADLDKIGKEWCILIATQESKGYLKLKKTPFYK